MNTGGIQMEIPDNYFDNSAQILKLKLFFENIFRFFFNCHCRTRTSQFFSPIFNT